MPTGASNATYVQRRRGLRFNRASIGRRGDTVYLVRPDGTVQDSHSYASPVMNVYQGYSFNRSPDTSATEGWSYCWDLHNYAFSTPGRRANGSPF